MPAVARGRMTAEPPPGTVVFLIGVRLNKPWKLTTWLPVVRAMPRMLDELGRNPELGLLGCASYRSGLTIMVVQYWASTAQLDSYAAASDREHLPAWREFNRQVRDNGDVGVFHETYVVDRHESIYVNMPPGFGLGGATSTVKPQRRGQRAAHRLDPTVVDTPVVDPY